jgi:hypothetical protein
MGVKRGRNEVNAGTAVSELLNGGAADSRTPR